MVKRSKVQVLGHGKVGKPYGLLAFSGFGKVFLVATWMGFLGVLFTMYILTFHRQSDFQKQSFRIKQEKQNLLDILQEEQKILSDMQALPILEDMTRDMIEVNDIKYINL